MAQRARLLCGFPCSCNDVLFFDRFNPKTRRKIGQVRDDGHERPRAIHARPAFVNLAVEMRNDRDKKVRWIISPILLEQIHERLVTEPNGPLQQAEKISAAESPAVLQKNLVFLLDADAC